ncbi:MAG: putative rane protein [Phenylobacterium sp.]|nr:putative rane protein [Phenylobacterium sp.]
MADTRDRLSKGLSEIRTVILGAQILLGFHYQAVFQPGFEPLPAWTKALAMSAFAAMLIVVIVLITPTPFHRLCEDGDATARQSTLISLVMITALAVFALAIGADVTVATSVRLPTAAAILLGLTATLVALFLWFGIELMQRRPATRRPAKADARLPLKEKISELLTEARIVLPGVQALLGFQFAAYLTDKFAKLDPGVQAVQTASLLLLLLAMLLLMAPAPFHRLAERGEDTARAEKVSQALVLAALAPMALGLAGDFYIALKLASHSDALAIAGGVATALCAAALWFMLPLGVRRWDRRGAASQKGASAGAFSSSSR